MLSLIRSFPALGLRSTVESMNLLRPALLDATQFRGRKRGLKKPMSREERMRRRLKREEKEAARKQYSFMERINIRRMKSLLSPSQQGPGRYDAEKEAHLPDKPPCNIFLRSTVKTQFYSMAEALEMLRELQRPEIYGNKNALVRLRIELNMTTERATKMVTSTDEIVPVPFPFKHAEKRTILALVNDPKIQEEAVEAGAEIALGQDAVKKIIKGQFRTEDYDFCVAHQDMAHAILPLRGVLKSRFPTRNNGGLGTNMTEIVERFRSGVKVAIKGDPVFPMWGLSDVVIGRLDSPNEELEANAQAVIEAICKHRNPALGSFINRAVLMTIPGESFFAVDVKSWLPVPTEEQLEQLEKRIQKKKDKKKEVKKAEDEEGDADAEAEEEKEEGKEAAKV